MTADGCEVSVRVDGNVLEVIVETDIQFCDYA